MDSNSPCPFALLEPLSPCVHRGSNSLLRDVHSNPILAGWFWHGASARAYGSSKLCNTMFAQSAHAKWAASRGVACCSLHPGTLMRSDMARDSPVANFCLKHVLSWFTKDLQQGASTTVFCTLCEHASLSGAFYADCKQVACSRLATDEACEALWQLSCSLLAPYLKQQQQQQQQQQQ
jgi:hypothetical protein